MIISWKMKDWTPAKIKRLRATAGITQTQFAEYLGVTQVHVAHLESGFRSVGEQTARLLEVLWRSVKADAKQSASPSPKKRRIQCKEPR